MIVEHELQGPVHVLRMTHGKVNALDLELVQTLTVELQDLSNHAGAVVLTGSGTTFSAGVDLRRVVEEGTDYIKRFIPTLGDMFETVFTAPIPIVAAINGWAIAGGCVLAAACDHRVLAAGAEIGATELSVGVPYPVSAFEILRHACGHYTDEVVLGAGLHSGDDCQRLGLANEVVAKSALMSRAVAAATALANMPRETYRSTKNALRAPTRTQIAADRTARDAEVIATWSSPATLTAIEEHLKHRLRKR